MLRKLIMTSLVLAILGVQGQAAENKSSEKNDSSEFIEVSASNPANNLTVRWKMPLEDSLLLARAAMEIGGHKFRKDIMQDIAGQAEALQRSDIEQLLSAQKDKLKLPSGLRTVDESKAPFRLECTFSTRYGPEEIYVSMPAHRAIGFLKAAFVIDTDDHFKSDIIEDAFAQYSNGDVRSDILAFLPALKKKTNL